MKAKVFSLILIAILLVGFQSCKKQEDEALEEEQLVEPLRLKRIIKHGYLTTIELDYDSLGRVVVIDGNAVVWPKHISYDSLNRISQIDQTRSYGERTVEWFTYDNDSQLIRRERKVFYEDSTYSPKEEEHDYFYENGKLVLEKMVKVDHVSSSVKRREIEYDEQENIVHIYSKFDYFGTSITCTDFLLFDEGPSPYPNKELALLLGENFNANWLVKDLFSNCGDEIIMTITREFTYGMHGLPIGIKESHVGYTNGALDYDHNYVFEYE